MALVVGLGTSIGRVRVGMFGEEEIDCKEGARWWLPGGKAKGGVVDNANGGEYDVGEDPA